MPRVFAHNSALTKHTVYMKNTLKTASLLLITALISTGCCKDQTCGLAKKECAKNDWQNLFALDLSNADYNKSVWSIDKDGVIRANKDEIIFTKADYQNFELELEFRIEKESNSGVVIYCTNTQKWIPNSIEVQIADSSCEKFGSATRNCAAIFGHVATEIDTRLPFGEWQKMKIRAEGQKIDVWLNGKHASKMDMSEWKDNKIGPNGVKILPWLTEHKKCEMPTVGKIGFQGKHGQAATDFRNIKIREIKK